METITKNTTETIAAVRVRVSDNYTCSDHQNRQRHCWSFTMEKPANLVTIAIALDLAHAAAIEKRGGSGMGAGACATIEIEECETTISSLDDPDLAGLPFGDVSELRKFIKSMATHQEWNGNNLINCPARISTELLKHRPR